MDCFQDPAILKMEAASRFVFLVALRGCANASIVLTKRRMAEHVLPVSTTGHRKPILSGVLFGAKKSREARGSYSI